ncbi:MAG TPA: hypothetical protein EYQ54_01055, partial [Myxococcales bacterium]|nr:hypothetical protein [Myxococcales bacterium]
MRLRLVATTILTVLVAALLGATVGADFLWRSAIGLDPTAFPAGQSLQSLGDLLFPGLDIALAGLLLGLGTVLGVPFVAFFVVRDQRRTLLEQTDPGRR